MRQWTVMLDLLIEAISFLLLIGMIVWFFLNQRRHLRHAAEAARRQADLHQQLVDAHTELAQVAFDDSDQLAATRFELADTHADAVQKLTKAAEVFDDLAAWPVPRWLRRRRSGRDTPP